MVYIYQIFVSSHAQSIYMENEITINPIIKVSFNQGRVFNVQVRNSKGELEDKKTFYDFEEAINFYYNCHKKYSYFHLISLNSIIN